jgi:methylmalonyl-CoA mutase C-terminal domain/subunit
MSEYGCSEIPIVLGGVIPETDIPILEKMGIKKVFLPGTSLQVIVEAIRKLVMTSSKLSVS